MMPTPLVALLPDTSCFVCNHFPSKSHLPRPHQLQCACLAAPPPPFACAVCTAGSTLPECQFSPCPQGQYRSGNDCLNCTAAYTTVQNTYATSAADCKRALVRTMCPGACLWLTSMLPAGVHGRSLCLLAHGCMATEAALEGAAHTARAAAPLILGRQGLMQHLSAWGPMLAAIRHAMCSPSPPAPHTHTMHHMHAVCRPGFGGTGCVRCAAGFYSAGGTELEPNQPCAKCPTGLTTLSVGATSLEGCTGGAPA